MTAKDLISALRTAPLDSRKASMDIYDLCVKAAAVMESYQRSIEWLYTDLLGYIPDDINPVVLHEGHGWIPVSERLPEDRSNVLVVAYWCERWGVYIAWCAPERAEWYVHVGIGDRSDVAVTHWMPLPELPEEG